MEEARYIAGLIIGIDPGPAQSALVAVHPDYTIEAAAKLDNDQAVAQMGAFMADRRYTQVAIEGLACYGRPVGRETFETAYMVGAFRQIAQSAFRGCTIYHRPEYANAIAGTGKVTDAMLFQALRFRFGGTKKGEPLALLRGESDLRSAFAVAVYHVDCQMRAARRG